MVNSLINIRPPHDDDDNPLNILKKELMIRKQQRDQIEHLMERFTNKLYEAFEKAVGQTLAAGIPGLAKPRRIPHPGGDWRQALQLFIEDWGVIIVPLAGAAWPNTRDDAKIAAAKFKEPCGRIALFVGDDPNAESFYDFLIFADGSWFAWGFGWPRVADNIEDTDFEIMALELLTSFVKDIHTTWRPRKVGNTGMVGTALNQSLDAKKRAYSYGLPGEE